MANVFMNFTPFSFQYRASRLKALDPFQTAHGLNNVQKWEDGDYLGGRSRAQDDFDALDIE